jgi:hypothetical protein
VAHYLLVIPFYFFTALATFLVLALVSRILRLKVGANVLATTAVILGVGAVAVPLALDWIDLAHLSGRQLLVIGGLTFALAALDTLLEPLLPVPFDQELSHF